MTGGWLSERSVDGGLDEVPLDGRVSGRLLLCGKRVVGPDPDAALRRGRADVIVCFNEREELRREFPIYLDWLIAGRGRRSRWWPIPDLGTPAAEEAVAIADELAALLVVGNGLILHCAGGIGRAPTMAICVLARLGWTIADAAAHVAAHRPTGGPEAGPQRELLARFPTLD